MAVSPTTNDAAPAAGLPPTSVAVTVMATHPSSAPVLVWVCACGQDYRMADTRDGVRFWPSTGAAAYSRGGLTAEAPCIRCGDRIRGKKPTASNVAQT
jgi:hypothetical protein